jgi:hypothetical protein
MFIGATMFEISGILVEKFHPQGQLLRMKNVFKTQLNTEAGVLRFLQEQQPFAELKIHNIIDNKDMTAYFLERLKNEGQTQ